MVNKLIELIGKEAAVFESFLELLEDQQEKLVRNDTDGLNQNTDRQRELLVNSQLLNKQRTELVAQIKEANQIEGDLNVTRLLDMVDKEQANRLSELRRVILTLNDQIIKTRNQNAILLNRSREYISKTMEMLSRLNTAESVYTPHGQDQTKTNAVAVDRRA